MYRKLAAECIGTFWLVVGGCGSAIFAGHQIGWHGVALAFGLTVLVMAFAIGHISGCHLNPAVSIGLWMGGRFSTSHVIPYIIAQTLGAIIAGGVLYFIATGIEGGYSIAESGFALNGYGNVGSPDHYSMSAAFASEFVMTMIFLYVIMGATDEKAPKGFAPIAIGLCLTLIHLISIPITNTSVNPARSTGVALYAGMGSLAVKQLWFFWVVPILGGAVGGILYRVFNADSRY
ncbi:aquaporin Z [Desulfosarcina sp. OttesenSCG-928-A07]|nr:aquaporin Z [Desulfosarcina sp. OttesenSCG-928-G17]MDL2329822.1 aquaporin Z [Desulfosarcina sp. OttesenSCG-928-A07]